MKRGCPMPIKGCKYSTRGGCYADDHHVYWPAPEYTTQLEQAFRELFVVNMCRRIHDELHDFIAPPPKSSKKAMKNVLNKLGD